MTRAYLAATHDPILSELNQKWRRTDQEIADEMGFDKRTITEHRVRLKLPMNSRPKPASYTPAHESVPLPKVKPNPLAVAKLWLGKRLVEKPSGYWLDDRPVNLTTLMRAANELMKEQGADQLAHNPGWLV